MIPTLRLSPHDTMTLEGGVLSLGVIGGGKSTGSAPALARAVLEQGCGGLFLCAHSSHVEQALRWIEDTGREDDLILFSEHRFNFLEWGRRSGFSVEHQVAMFTQALESLGRQDGTPSQDNRFWSRAMQSTIRSAIVLAILAKAPLSLDTLSRILNSAPGKGDPDRLAWRHHSFCWQLLEQAREHVKRCGNPLLLHDLEQVESYWLSYWASLADRTKTSIVSVADSLMSPLLYGELHQMCNTEVTLDPAWTHQGALIVMDLPSEERGAGALTLQVIMKFAWQIATRRRVVREGDLTTFCFADEAALFTTSSDTEFLSVARNKRACQIYCGHSVSEFAEKIGETATKALFGHFRAKIFHALNDPASMQYAADLIGQTWQEQITDSHADNTIQGGVYPWLWPFFTWKPSWVRFFSFFFSTQTSESVSVTDRLAPQVLPVEFTTLRTGGPKNGFLIDAILFQSGTIWSTGKNFLRVTFPQEVSLPKPLVFLTRRLYSWFHSPRSLTHSPLVGESKFRGP